MTEYLEQDYQPVVHDVGKTRFLAGTRIEIVHEVDLAHPPAHVLFDFDGTLSLIREGWPEVMVPMMVELLAETGTDESPQDLHKLAHGFVTELTGKQTIYQMIRLVDEIIKRGGITKHGGRARPPQEYKQMYLDRLMERIGSRREDLRAGKVSPGDMLVPGSVQIMEQLRAKGAQLYLASGTDEPYVREEAALLGIADYFGKHIYGAVEDYKSSGKAQVIAQIIEVNRVDGSRLLGFGDGYVELQEVKQVGGTAVGVATDERRRSGEPDPWKRSRLIGIGADVIVPDLQACGHLIAYLWCK